MAVIRKGQNTALLVVDVQQGVMKNAWDAARVVGNVASAVQQARATAYAALERGYDLTLIEDTHSTVDMPVSSELTIPAVTTAPNAVNSRHNRRINCGESSWVLISFVSA